MAVTAENTVAPEFKNQLADGYAVDAQVAASTVIYKWSFVGYNASGYLTSYVAPTAATTATGAAPNGTSFLGVALENIPSQTADGDRRCRVQIQGTFTYTLTSVAVTELGAPVFATDNSTLASTGGSARVGAFVGTIIGIDSSDKATIQMGSIQDRSTGKLHVVVSPAISYATANNKVLLVHESENPTGMLLCTCTGYCTETFVTSADTTPDITLQHTADTTLGCVITAVDNGPIGDSVAGVGGQLWGIGSATADDIILIPAGTQVNAEVTDPADESSSEAGSIIICATFVRV